MAEDAAPLVEALAAILRRRGRICRAISTRTRSSPMCLRRSISEDHRGAGGAWTGVGLRRTGSSRPFGPEGDGLGWERAA
jgi:hypothetical protein